MIIAATLAILVVMVLAIIRGVMGPSLYDRILAVNMFGTKTVLLISLLGFADTLAASSSIIGLLVIKRTVPACELAP